MKVYELISKLSEYPAGADVFVDLPFSMRADIEDFDYTDGMVTISGGEADVIDYQECTRNYGQMMDQLHDLEQGNHEANHAQTPTAE